MFSRKKTREGEREKETERGNKMSEPSPASLYGGVRPASAGEERQTPLPEAPCPSELRLVLLGRKGAGKSSAGNTILGISEGGFTSGSPTEECMERWANVAGRRVVIVDTPGWEWYYPLNGTPEWVKWETVRSVTLSPPGPHALLLVVRACASVDGTYRKEIQEHMELLGEGIWKHTLVLFTQGDNPEDLADRIHKGGEDFRLLVEKCGNRWHVLSSKTRGREATQVAELLQKVEKMAAANGGAPLEMEQARLRLEQENRGRRPREERRSQRLLEERKLEESLQEIFARDGCHVPWREAIQARWPPGHGRRLLDLRVVLLGERETGKSLAGNAILGGAPFQAGRVTEECTSMQDEVAGRRVTVVDTPGWESKRTPERVRHEIRRSVTLCPPGAHALLLVVGVDSDISVQAATEHLGLLGEEAWRYALILFTGRDKLRQGVTIEQHVQSSAKAHQLVERCEGRYHVISGVEPMNTQVMELLEKVEALVAGNGGQPFTPLTHEIKELMVKKEERWKNEMETKARKERTRMSFEKKPKEREKIEGRSEMSRQEKEERRQTEMWKLQDKILKMEIQEMKEKNDRVTAILDQEYKLREGDIKIENKLKIEEKEREIKSLREKNEETEIKILTAERAIHDDRRAWEEEREKMHQQSAKEREELEKSIEEEKKKNSELMERTAAMEKETDESRRLCRSLAKTEEELQKIIQNKTTEIVELNQLNQEKKQELKDLAMKCSRSQEEVENLKEKKKEKDLMLDKMKECYEEQRMKREAEIKENIQKRDLEIKELTHRNAAKERELCDRRQEFEKKQHQREEEWRVENEKVKKQMEETKEMFEMKEKEVEEMRERFEHSDRQTAKLEVMIKQLRTENAELMEKINITVKERDAIKQHHGEKELQREDEMEGVVREKDKEIKEMKKELNELQKKNDEKEREVDELRCIIEEREEETVSLKKYEENQKQREEEWRDTYEKLQREMVDIKQMDEEKRQGREAEIESVLQLKEKLITELKQKHEECERNLLCLRERYETLSLERDGEIEEIKEKCEDYRKEREEQRKRAETREIEIREMEQRNNTQMRDIEEMEERNEKKDKEMENKKRQYEEELRMIQLEMKLKDEEREREAERCTQTLAEREAQLEQKGRRISELMHQAQENEKIAGVKEKRLKDELGKRVEQLEETIREKVKEVEEMRGKYEQSERQTAKLEVMIKQLRTDTAELVGRIHIIVKERDEIIQQRGEKELQREEDMEGVIREKDKEIKHMKMELNELQKKKYEKEREVDKLRHIVEEREEKRSASLQKYEEEQKQREEEWRDKYDKIQKEMEGIKQMDEEKRQTREAEIQSVLEAKEKVINELKLKYEESKRNLAFLRERYETLSLERDGVIEEIKEKCEYYRKEKEEQRTRAETSEAEIRELKTNYEENRRNMHTENERKLSEQEAEIREMEGALKEKDQAMEQMKMELKGEVDAIRGIIEEREEEMKKHEEVQKLSEDMWKGKYEMMEREMKDVKQIYEGKWKVIETDMEVKERCINELKKKHEGSEKRLVSITEEYEDTQEQVEKLEGLISQREAELEEIRKRCKEYKKELEELQEASEKEREVDRNNLNYPEELKNKEGIIPCTDVEDDDGAGKLIPKPMEKESREKELLSKGETRNREEKLMVIVSEREAVIQEFKMTCEKKEREIKELVKTHEMELNKKESEFYHKLKGTEDQLKELQLRYIEKERKMADIETFYKNAKNGAVGFCTMYQEVGVDNREREKDRKEPQQLCDNEKKNMEGPRGPSSWETISRESQEHKAEWWQDALELQDGDEAPGLGETGNITKSLVEEHIVTPDKQDITQHYVAAEEISRIHTEMGKFAQHKNKNSINAVHSEVNKVSHGNTTALHIKAGKTEKVAAGVEKEKQEIREEDTDPTEGEEQGCVIKQENEEQEEEVNKPKQKKERHRAREWSKAKNLNLCSNNTESLNDLLPNELRLVLLGESWASNSTAGNSILGGQEAMTEKGTVRRGQAAGRRVALVEVTGPKWYLGGEAAGHALQRAALCSPGPHAFLLVIPAYLSFTASYSRAVRFHMAAFGKQVWKHTLVLFTWAEALGESAEQHILRNEDLRRLVHRCGNRYHTLNSWKNASQVSQLLEKVEEMVASNQGRFYGWGVSEEEGEEAEGRAERERRTAADWTAGERKECSDRKWGEKNNKEEEETRETNEYRRIVQTLRESSAAMVDGLQETECVEKVVDPEEDQELFCNPLTRPQTQVWNQRPRCSLQ